MEISVDSEIKIKIGDTEIVLSKTEAELLRDGLTSALNTTSVTTIHNMDTWGGNVNWPLNTTPYPYDQTK